jgi:hypothetical protein
MTHEASFAARFQLDKQKFTRVLQAMDKKTTSKCQRSFKHNEKLAPKSNHEEKMAPKFNYEEKMAPKFNHEEKMAPKSKHEEKMAPKGNHVANSCSAKNDDFRRKRFFEDVPRKLVNEMEASARLAAVCFVASSNGLQTFLPSPTRQGSVVLVPVLPWANVMITIFDKFC